MSRFHNFTFMNRDTKIFDRSSLLRHSGSTPLHIKVYLRFLTYIDVKFNTKFYYVETNRVYPSPPATEVCF